MDNISKTASIEEIAEKAYGASSSIANAGPAIKLNILGTLKDLLIKNKKRIEAENADDIESAKAAGLSKPMLDRLFIMRCSIYWNWMAAANCLKARGAGIVAACLLYRSGSNWRTKKHLKRRKQTSARFRGRLNCVSLPMRLWTVCRSYRGFSQTPGAIANMYSSRNTHWKSLATKNAWMPLFAVRACSHRAG